MRAGSHEPDTLTIVAGVPNGEWEAPLDEWTAAALEAVPLDEPLMVVPVDELA